MSTSWERIARPQSDAYDTQVILEQLEAGYRGRLGLVGDGAPVWERGRARWSSLTEMPAPYFRPCSPDSVTAVQGIKLLDLWPEARDQCADLLYAIVPLTQGSQGGHGCACGNYSDDFGWIYVTADDAWGFAEGIVHEMAHWKLRALGIWFEDWTDVILNHTFSQVYSSPVRKDKLRPMGAVLHGQYSYVHVAEMVRRMLEAKLDADAADVAWLELQLDRITEGQATLRANAIGTPGVGDSFLIGLDAWTSEVIAAGRSTLAARASA